MGRCFVRLAYFSPQSRGTATRGLTCHSKLQLQSQTRHNNFAAIAEDLSFTNCDKFPPKISFSAQVRLASSARFVVRRASDGAYLTAMAQTHSTSVLLLAQYPHHGPKSTIERGSKRAEAYHPPLNRGSSADTMPSIFIHIASNTSRTCTAP
jgi:hypothetical protein